jgi:hypothetical protein
VESVTNDEGIYHFDKLPKGYWQLAVIDKSGHQRLSNHGSSLEPYGSSIPPLWIDDDSPEFSDCRVDFLLLETGTIRGSVSGAGSKGRGLFVAAIESFADGSRGPTADETYIEDDGTFKLTGLPGGIYIVAVKAEKWDSTPSGMVMRDPWYGPPVRIKIVDGEQKSGVRVTPPKALP